MRLDYKVSSFVIVGNWNPNIVNEAWIKKNLLDHPNEQVNMGFKNPASPGIRVSTPAAMFRHVLLTVSGDRLELNLLNSTDFGYIEDCVRRICNCQSNTLVSAYGVNLTYIGDGIRNELIKRFTADPLSQKSFTENHSYAIHLDSITTNITIELNKMNNKSGIGFNFHFNISDLSALIQHITDYPIATLNKKAIQFILDQYELRLES